MASVKSIKPICGSSAFTETPFWSDSDENMHKAFELLKKHGVDTIDTAQAYAGSEEKLGKLKAGPEFGFTFDTKWRGGYSTNPAVENSRSQMLATAKESLRKLGVSQVDIFYLHAPDYKTPFEEILNGVNDAYKAGLFRRFGVSNFTPKDVQDVYDFCKSNNLVLPTVYQGNYSALARLQEDELLPLLRKLNMSFYAYSPIAGGFLTKTKEQIQQGTSRFQADQMFGIYHSMFVKESMLDALDAWAACAQEEGVSKAELAYRWIAFNSYLKPEHGDGMVFGVSSLAQLEKTLSYLEHGPLSDKAAKEIENIWKHVKKDAVVDNFQDVINRFS